MRKKLTALVGLVYSVPASLFLVFFLLISLGGSGRTWLLLLLLPIALMLVVSVLALVNMATARRAAKEQSFLSFHAVSDLKMCLIPFYIANFLFWVFSLGVFHIMIVVLPLYPFVLAYTYLTLLGTSSYHIAHLSVLYRNGVITKGQYRKHFFFQCLFVIDILDSIYLAAKYAPLDAALPRPTPQG